MRLARQRMIRGLFDQYIEMYAARDDRLTQLFSENFTGFAGSSDVLVNDRSTWIEVTRRDFAQVPGRLRIEMDDIALQDLRDDLVVVTAFFHIYLPVPEQVLSHETVRLVLIFRLEGSEWKISHSSISVPFGHALAGEVYPMSSMKERNVELEALVAERTRALEAANNRLQALSNTDGLTGIANRRQFDHVIAEEWNRSLRTGKPLSVIMLDVDLFKHYNDRYGHVAGDACLKDLAKALSQSGRRAGELVARYGGEEFVVVLPETAEAGALEAAQRLQNALWALAIPHEGVATGTVTLSLGVATLQPTESTTSDDLVRKADRALYQAKQGGRNCLRVATD